MGLPLFRVVSVSIASNAYGQEMRRIRLAAVSGEDFQADPEDIVVLARTPPRPDGEASFLVGVKAAKTKYHIGSLHALEPREP